ncbi:hypothetical protein CPB86DRAFT_825346 [Serendipita vermifera]|nr:hypothetical protein CPB86DRAFT_825346 [Serendipita vermifera]
MPEGRAGDSLPDYLYIFGRLNMSTAPSQAPTVESDSIAGTSSQILFFEHDKQQKENELLSLVHPDHLKALQNVLQSQPWQEQSGELDRFLLQGLLELRSEGDSEVYTCRFMDCPYRNAETTNAVEHIRGRHFGNRPFPCPICRTTFTRKADMLSHKATHEEATHECEDCGKAFTKGWNLTRHRKTHGRTPSNDAQAE